MTKSNPRSADETPPSAPDFDPVKLRYRHDGLTPARQVAVVQALAECGCVREACARVGISAEAVYRLRRRPDAQSFRLAMDMALDGAVDLVENGVFSRAINGVEIPHYYKGELVGTHRRHDERLALFLLRYRKPYRYGKYRDRVEEPAHPERSALGLAELLTWVESDAHRDAAGRRRQVATAVAQGDDEEPLRMDNLFRWGPAAHAPAADAPAGDQDDLDDLDFDPAEGAPPPDVARPSSTSAKSRNRHARRAAAAKRRKR
jgi:hypothetical protein